MPLSPPARRRGLKHVLDARAADLRSVASRAEAWIETSTRQMSNRCQPTSPPARRRGLKQRHPSVEAVAEFVASRAEAWIETII